MSQTKRCYNWNYRGRGIYLLTMVTNGRKPLLGQLTQGEAGAYIQYSSLGNKVANQIERLTARYPQLSICTKQIMPDHVHIVLWVQEPIPVSLGQILRGLKAGCTQAYMEEFAQKCATQNSQSDGHHLGLWEPGFNDRICLHRGQLQAMIAYVHDNPRRALLKRTHPDLFKLQRNIERADMHFTALGNLFLLDYPEKVVVQCSRSMTEEEIEAQKREMIEQASRGVVCVSAAISEGEKRICRAIRESGYPLIILMKDGFPDDKDESSRYYKPGGVYFDACAAGRLLLLEPHNQVYELSEIRQTVNAKTMADLPHTANRYRFLALNKMAQMLCQ